MKITTSELKQIIKEEAERFAKIKTLETEKNKVTKQLNEMFAEDAGVAECGPMGMEESDEELEKNATVIDEGIVDAFKNPRDEEGAKLLLKKDMEEVISKSDAPDSVKDSARSMIDTKIERAGELYKYNAIPVLYQKKGADRGAGMAEAGKWAFSIKAGGPQTAVGKWFAERGKEAGEVMRSENIEESKSVREIAREEAEKVAKVNKLKEKADKIINEINSL